MKKRLFIFELIKGDWIQGNQGRAGSPEGYLYTVLILFPMSFWYTSSRQCDFD